MNNLINEIKKRRTFAIISHPDAGKTTLTEKLLLYGGAIREAGAVKNRKSQKQATSDWMEIEKQRGISVSSSVMQFEYDGFCINILDTPGHQDFSEDTYRTLMAADCALMVIDHAKGVEEQTKKLFQVCKMRNIPIFTFINKLDRVGRDNFEIIEEIEKLLNIKSYPVNWPIGEGNDFKGIYSRETEEVFLFNSSEHGSKKVEKNVVNINSSEILNFVDENKLKKLKEEIELLDIAGDEFDINKVLSGDLTPVYFGSALTNFGVEIFLESFLKISKEPEGYDSDIGKIDINSDFFSGFIFKIQANMDPSHRDRIAFLKICSGKFEKAMSVNHIRLNRNIKISNSTQFMAQSRENVDFAVAGDIIGIYDTQNIYQIGDTLTNSNKIFNFNKIPSFAPEHFCKIYIKNALKRKQFLKGIEQLAQEGTIQVFKRLNTGAEELIVGVVGVLQFDVLKHRLSNEYSVEVIMESLSYRYLRWIKNEFEPDNFVKALDTVLVESYGLSSVKYAVLLNSLWSIDQLKERNKNIIFSDINF